MLTLLKKFRPVETLLTLVMCCIFTVSVLLININGFLPIGSEVNNSWFSSPTEQVKGASDTKYNYNECTEKSPIIGWIDYSGKKKIVDKLPQNTYPSACFSTIQEAQNSGYQK